MFIIKSGRLSWSLTQYTQGTYDHAQVVVHIIWSILMVTPRVANNKQLIRIFKILLIFFLTERRCAVDDV